MLDVLHTYYAKNYAGVIDSGLATYEIGLLRAPCQIKFHKEINPVRSSICDWLCKKQPCMHKNLNSFFGLAYSYTQ